MKSVLLTGDHPRHRHLADRLFRKGWVDGLVVQRREPPVPEPPDGLGEGLADLFRLHFRRRADAEDRFFGDAKHPRDAVPSLEISPDELNGERVHTFLQKLDPNVFLTYGTNILTPDTLNTLSGARWNVHGGLSPWYRGTITHFWPSYLLEPQFTGMTLHELTADVDAGPVIHQTQAPLVAGDGLHDLACRAVDAFTEELPRILALHKRDELSDPVTQSSTGRLWRNRDWRPEHLRLIYDVHGDSIVDAYLDGDLSRHQPDLVRQFPPPDACCP